MSQNIDETLGFGEEPKKLKDIEELLSGKSKVLHTRSLKQRESLRVSDMQVLCLLQLQAMNGYELKKNLLQTFGYNISFGTLYPHLRALEGSKLVLGKWISKKPKKRIYALTDKGREALRSNALHLSRLLQLIFDSAKEK